MGVRRSKSGANPGLAHLQARTSPRDPSVFARRAATVASSGHPPDERISVSATSHRRSAPAGQHGDEDGVSRGPFAVVMSRAFRSACARTPIDFALFPCPTPAASSGASSSLCFAATAWLLNRRRYTGSSGAFACRAAASSPGVNAP